MTTTEHALLIILSAALALLLILAISAMVLVIRLIASLRAIAQKAESVIDSAESVTQLFRKAAGPVTILHFVRNVADAVMNAKQDKKSKG